MVMENLQMSTKRYRAISRQRQEHIIGQIAMLTNCGEIAITDALWDSNPTIVYGHESVTFTSIHADSIKHLFGLISEYQKGCQVPLPSADEFHNTQCCDVNHQSFDGAAVPPSIARVHRATAAIARAKSQYGTCNKSAQPRTKQEPIH